MNYRLLAVSGVLAVTGCAGMPGVEMGNQEAKTVATGSAGGSTTANANSRLERCDDSLGTLAVIEDQGAPWYYQLRNEYKLQSTVPFDPIAGSAVQLLRDRGTGSARLQPDDPGAQSGSDG